MVAAVSGIIITPYKCPSAVHDLVCYLRLFLEAEKIVWKPFISPLYLSHRPAWSHRSKGNGLPRLAYSKQEPTPPPLPRLAYSVQDTPTTIIGLYSAGIPVIVIGLTSQYVPLPRLLCMEETGHLNCMEFYEKRNRPCDFEEGTKRFELQNLKMQIFGGLTFAQSFLCFLSCKGE